MSDPFLTTEALTVGHGHEPLLRELKLELAKGKLVALLGVNGIGKSTLLRTLAGLQEPLSGRVLVEGKDLYRMLPMDRARTVSVVLSGRPAAGLVDVRTLVGLGRQPWTGVFGKLSTGDEERIEGAMEITAVAPLQHRQVQELSDGELQKVMIARAVAQDTPLLFLDEPTAFLDVANRVKLLELLRTLAGEQGRTILFSTHDLQLALEVSDGLWLIDHERSVWQGAPAEALSSGLLERTFAREGLRFDPLTRSFHISR